jgi:hypothetical protein
MSDLLGRKDGFQPIAPVGPDGLSFGISHVDGVIQVITIPSDTNMEGGGKISVGTTAIEVTFATTPNSILLSAANDNIGTLYYGKSDVTSLGANAVGYLDAGEKAVLFYNNTTNAVWIVADQAAQNFFKGGFS